jgi:hypothetical protein
LLRLLLGPWLLFVAVTCIGVLLARPLLAQSAPAASSAAHDSRLELRVEDKTVIGDWKVPVSWLDAQLRLDANRDGEVTWPEMEPRREEIELALRSRLIVHAAPDDVSLKITGLVYGTQQGEALILASVRGLASRQAIDLLEVDRALLFSQSGQDRMHVKVVWSGRGTSEATLNSKDGAVTLTRASAAGSGFFDLLQSGVWHIWTGYDHILFLLVLLIPAVFERTAQGRSPVRDFRAAFARVTIIVSSFTIAHSITLTCAAMQWIVLPSRLVESSIAASIFAAAVLNFLPTTAGVRGAWLAFGFGLLHGFGFASVLSEIDVGAAPLWRALVAFNLGVEVGQLAIVAAFLPMAFVLRNTKFYRTGVVYGGSTIAGLCALLWFWRRAF